MPRSSSSTRRSRAAAPRARPRLQLEVARSPRDEPSVQSGRPAHPARKAPPAAGGRGCACGSRRGPSLHAPLLELHG
eukprot:14371909-Alexandrium_andersonii.AAC.1